MRRECIEVKCRKVEDVQMHPKCLGLRAEGHECISTGISTVTSSSDSGGGLVMWWIKIKNIHAMRKQGGFLLTHCMSFCEAVRCVIPAANNHTY